MGNLFAYLVLATSLAIAAGCDAGRDDRRRRTESVEPEALPPPRAAAPLERVGVAPPAAPEDPAIDVSPEQLRKDYKANEVSADERYRGKVLRVTGTVKAITRGSLDEPSLITLATSSPFVGVFAYFDRLSADALSGALTKLSHGSRVRVRCVGDNLLVDNPRLKDCALQ